MKRPSTKKTSAKSEPEAESPAAASKKPTSAKAESAKGKVPGSEPTDETLLAADTTAKPKKPRASSPRPRAPKVTLEPPLGAVAAAAVPPKPPEMLAPEPSKPSEQKTKSAEDLPAIGKGTTVTPSIPKQSKPLETDEPAKPLTPKILSEISGAVPPKSQSIAGFKLPVPAILLEGDEPVSPQHTGPGEKFAVGTLTSVPGSSQAHQLPSSHGTGRLTAIARDPWSIFVHWDFTDEQQDYYNSLSADHHLVIRARFESASGPVAGEAHLHAGTRHWFLHVPRPGAQYVVELGYYLSDGQWTVIKTSTPVTTQTDRASEDQSAHFASAAPGTPSIEFWAPDRAASPEFHESIKTPVLPDSRPSRWTEAQELALTELIITTVKKEPAPGSLEILELLRRQVQRRVVSPENELALPGPSSAALGISSLQRAEEQGPSSPLGAEQVPPRKDFWFNINAELIIYGATEPDARVTIAGRPIQLRPDGTFSYRFALPDGYYELPAAAAPADKTEVRRADLRFSRQTAYSGEVGAHRQDQALRVPAAENLA